MGAYITSHSGIAVTKVSVNCAISGSSSSYLDKRLDGKWKFHDDCPDVGSRFKIIFTGPAGDAVRRFLFALLLPDGESNGQMEVMYPFLAPVQPRLVLLRVAILWQALWTSSSTQIATDTCNVWF